ncbi:uncharacterized protein LOC128338442 isoform X1 [Hemicordylus capensis]|uniref:uncharacterized protein LOC128338442 isoform X1 n=1 Tax=Hemicordylus capensis TaxID=884348 RepID=UPI002302701A|nr:uncharacterized protein LOC128338442 isoform X1 [Hemicordylus capensis]
MVPGKRYDPLLPGTPGLSLQQMVTKAPPVPTPARDPCPWNLRSPPPTLRPTQVQSASRLLCLACTVSSRACIPSRTWGEPAGISRDVLAKRELPACPIDRDLPATAASPFSTTWWQASSSLSSPRVRPATTCLRSHQPGSLAVLLVMMDPVPGELKIILSVFGIGSLAEGICTAVLTASAPECAVTTPELYCLSVTLSVCSILSAAGSDTTCSEMEYSERIVPVSKSWGWTVPPQFPNSEQTTFGLTKRIIAF